MTDTPGWASPGSSPSGDPDHGATPPGGGTPERPAPPYDAAPQPGAPSNWSRQQPPPGQWSAPAGNGPPPPGPTWGAPGGLQPGPWGKPPAAKPGVIPLRPLGVSEILDGAVSTMRAHWRTVLGISLAVALVVQTATVLVQGLLLRGTDTSALQNRNADLDEVMEALGNIFAGSGVALLIGLIGTILATAMLTMVVSRAVLGQTVTTGEAWRDARPRVPGLLGLTLLLFLIGFAILAVGLTPGLLLAWLSPATGNARVGGIALALLGGFGAFIVMLWVLTRYSLASPALMLEKQGILKALSRSAKLVRGAWWRVFGIQLLAALLVTIVSSIITIPFTVIAVVAGGDGLSAFSQGQVGALSWTFLIITGIGAVVGSTITLPISSGVTALLYMDQRIRREALDIELARAAGLPGYDAPQAAAHHPSGSNATGG